MTNVSHRMTFCDPVHHAIDFGVDPAMQRLLKALIRSPAFQRLRRISQLGLASYVFPGATHTRFAHGLGAAHLAGAALQQLADAFPKDAAEIKRHRPILVAAALLHDVGHGPFSHAFERALDRVLAASSGANKQTPLSHEAWTRAIIRGPLAEPIARSTTAFTPKDLASLFSKDECDLPLYLRQLISSQLDVDRLDYLTRDAYFTGVPLGQIDLHYLMRELAVVRHGGDHRTLGITHKGIKAYEAFALARHHMNRCVYYHPKVSILEFMMEECIAALFQEAHARRHARGAIPAPVMDLGSALRKHPRHDALLEHGCEAYLSLSETDIWVAAAAVARRRSGRASRFAEALLTRRIPRFIRVSSGQATHVEKLLSQKFEPDAYKVLKRESTAYRSASHDAVFVGQSDGSIAEVSSCSFAITAYNNRPESDALLVLLDDKCAQDIESAAHRCLERPPAAHRSKPAAGRPRRARGRDAAKPHRPAPRLPHPSAA